MSSAARPIWQARKISRSADGKIAGRADDAAAPAAYRRTGQRQRERSTTMNGRTQDRLFALCGIASVVLELTGAGIASAGGMTHDLTISATPAQLAHAVAKPAGSLVWVGAYSELLSVGAFLAFAVWACAKLGGGLLGQFARAAATSQATVTVASLGVAGAVASRAGHGVSIQLASALVTVNEALYICTWFMSAFFLLGAGALALTAGRRALGWSGVGIALVTLVATAVSFDNLGQLSIMLWFAWIIYASVALARGERAPVGAVAIA
jgi:hypothetical protein